ncbi:MAG: methionine ABC transporter ATP-binding protein [Lachnospiraceae bacterium]
MEKERKYEMSAEAIIRLEGLGKQFSTANGTVNALDNINLEIEKGEIFGIIGLSGAGKSTLVRCINFLEKPTAGKVIFEGQSLGDLGEAKIRAARRSMGMIFQQFNLLAQRNVLQNVCFPLEIAGVPKAEAKEKAKELLKMVGLEERMKAYPAQLSGGQKQRVAIARALATNPKVLLCDEATSALDPNTTKSILQLLKQINRDLGVTVIVITHEMAVIEAICDRVAIIDKSHIAESGKVSEIFSEPKSKIGRQLILGDAVETGNFGGGRQIRIIFDGRASSEPVLANMILACKTPVNIMYAATRDINGTAMGQMIVQLPEDEADARRVTNYLSTAKVPYEEVNEDAV